MEALRKSIANKRSTLNTSSLLSHHHSSSSSSSNQNEFNSNKRPRLELKSNHSSSSNKLSPADHSLVPLASSSSCFDSSCIVVEQTISTSEQQSKEEADHRPNSFEIKKRLRGMNQPICLFGEDENQRWLRFRAAEIARDERAEVAASGGRNILHEILSKEVERDLKIAALQDLEHKKLSSNPQEIEPKNSIASSQSPQQQQIKSSDSSRESTSSNKIAPHHRSSSEFEHKEDYVLYFIKRCLQDWEQALESRTVEEKHSLHGKMATATQKQTREYLRPLVVLLKARACDPDLLNDIHLVCQLASKAEYERANEAYLKLAIGQAPWPMGVTMVSIHQRSGRSRIQGDQVAHVLNDETQRKYISSLKRLISWLQESSTAKV